MNGTKTGPLLLLLLAGFTTSNPVNENPQDLDRELYGSYYNGGPRQSADYVDSEADEEMTPTQRRKAAYLYELLRAMQQEQQMAQDAGDEAIVGPATGGLPVVGVPAEAAEAAAPGQQLPGDVHSVDKRRRRRYGFWVTAINKMDSGHLKGFLGRHRNIFNVKYKRGGNLAFPRMH